MANDDIILKLECADYDDSRIDAVTRDLARSLREEGVGAAMASQWDAAPGKKGDPVTIGAIVLTLIQTGGVAVTLLQVLKAYLARKCSDNAAGEHCCLIVCSGALDVQGSGVAPQGGDHCISLFWINRSPCRFPPE